MPPLTAIPVPSGPPSPASPPQSLGAEVSRLQEDLAQLRAQHQRTMADNAREVSELQIRCRSLEEEVRRAREDGQSDAATAAKSVGAGTVACKGAGGQEGQRGGAKCLL